MIRVLPKNGVRVQPFARLIQSLLGDQYLAALGRSAMDAGPRGLREDGFDDDFAYRRSCFLVDNVAGYRIGVDTSLCRYPETLPGFHAHVGSAIDEDPSVGFDRSDPGFPVFSGQHALEALRGFLQGLAGRVAERGAEKGLSAKG